MSQVEQIIWSLPAWASIALSDRRSRSALLSRLNSLRRFTLDDIRVAMEDYIKTCIETGDGYDVDEMSRLYIVNRFVFAVPRRVSSRQARFFGGWGGVPETAEYANLCGHWTNGKVGYVWPELFKDTSAPRMMHLASLVSFVNNSAHGGRKGAAVNSLVARFTQTGGRAFSV